MTQLTGLILSDDNGFLSHVSRLFRSARVPVKTTEERSADLMPRTAEPYNLVVMDIRGEGARAMAAVERLRGRLPGASIVAIAATASSDLILDAMRAGANEFLAWPPDEDAFRDAMRRIVGKRDTVQNDRAPATTLAFFGAKGGAGTTTMAVNTGVELARLSRRKTLVVDLKPGLGEVALFLGVRPRYSVIDAIDNLHRLDHVFLRQIVIEHKSGLDILSGSDLFDRPGAADTGAIEALLSLLARQYDYVVIDAGSQITHSSPVVFQSANHLFLVANPDVPCVRNAQRLLERVRKMRGGERTDVLLNRAAEPYPIPLRQIESALGQSIHHTFPSDYKTVSTALNSGVPLALAGHSDIAAQLDEFTRRLLSPSAASEAPDPGSSRRSLLNLDRLASLW